MVNLNIQYGIIIYMIQCSQLNSYVIMIYIIQCSQPDPNKHLYILA